MRSSIWFAAVFAGCAAGVEDGRCSLSEPFTQGTLVASDSATDFALEGPGFFVLAEGDALAFTRQGHFVTDEAGHLLGPGGARLQRLAPDARPLDLVIGPTTRPPIATSVVVLHANLDADMPRQTFDPLDPSGTSAIQMFNTLFDSRGARMAVDLFFTRVGASAWELHALTDGAHLAGGTAGLPTEFARTTLTFDAEGSLVSGQAELSMSSRTGPQPLRFVLDGVTQHSGASSVSLFSQDGAPTGRLEAFSFNLRGELIGRYSNGVVDVLGVVALADFPQPTGLSTTHDGLLRETVWSGLHQLGTPDVGGLGRLVARSLETAPPCD